MANNPDGQLNRKEFIKLYSSLRYESPELLDEISELIFKAFDADKSGKKGYFICLCKKTSFNISYINSKGTISFSEFLIAYGLTSENNLKYILF